MKRLVPGIMVLLALLALMPAASAAPLGRLIAVDSTGPLYEVDPTTGALTPIGTVSVNSGTRGALAYDASSGTIYLSSTNLDQLFTLDLGSGNATLVGAYGVDVVMHGLEWDSSTGTLYGASGAGTVTNALYSINTSTGAASWIGDTGLETFSNLGYDSTNDIMYLTDSATDSLYTVDRLTGVPILVGALNGPTNPNALAYASDIATMFLLDNTTDSMYTLNLSTGQATLVGAHGIPNLNLLGLVYIPGAAVPESATIALLVIGLAGLRGVRRRQSA